MSVCSDQDNFNKAFSKAADEYEKSKLPSTKEMSIAVIIYSLLYFLFLVWAIILAMRIQDREHRMLHMVFAIGASPLYVLSHYVANISMSSSN
jgi:hypothetical protein